ncbi:hypothetical protein QQS45_10295 [Alteriqipengyuania flavescens]|uniref:hypothetical protein n=1 Tax=Alteriqipengyuania flavescens TaxID=3053610 RepID=UPI0025B3BFF8|nr:hypothetical protein [Alteriqipengyuania flavescens]WJY18014.1 hypothetical protein QQW98_10290 [Alteriqipengyuania flavescens]WJY23955.1 hypothetical protein QQS45_10295 [Alteriqipengyuania flavescens]
MGDAIELHLFEHGYASIVLQEDDSANICLALRKERLAQADADPHELLTQVAARSWQSGFARRAARPVRAARAAWTLAERPALARLALPLARIVPSLLRPAMRMTRID